MTKYVKAACKKCGKNFWRRPRKTERRLPTLTECCSIKCATGELYAGLPSTKTCGGCKETRAAEDFGLTAKLRLRERCKVCRKRGRQTYVNNARYKYGVTDVELGELVSAQGNACAICRHPFAKTPHIDHCHTHGHVRGLLCLTCNAGLGQMKDDPALLRRAAEYLESRAKGR